VNTEELNNLAERAFAPLVRAWLKEPNYLASLVPQRKLSRTERAINRAKRMLARLKAAGRALKGADE
jgi:hypothetical protein